MKTNRIVCLSFVLMALAGPVAHATGPEARRVIYQEQVSTNRPGVFLVGDDAFVNVRLPIKKFEQINRVRLTALLKANQLLKEWAVAQTAAARQLPPATPGGVKLALAVADVCNPDWRYSDWNVNFKGQECALGRRGGEYVLGMAFSKADLLAAIPASFKDPLPTNLMVTVLQRDLPRVLKSRPQDVFALCGAYDLMAGDVRASGAFKAERDRVEKEVRRYLKTSPFAADLKASAAKIRTPQVSETWSESVGRPQTKTNDVVSIVTNRLPVVLVTTNRTLRAETAEERVTRGIALRGNFAEEHRDSYEEEVVETRTVTTVTTIRKKRNRHVTLVSGMPLFEDVFLSGGKTANPAAPQLDSGSTAAKSYFDSSVTLETRERLIRLALAENPGDKQMWNMFGNCLMKRSDALGALVCFRCAAKLDAFDEFTLVNLANAYRALDCPLSAGGMAVLARGMAKHPWCVGQADGILFKPFRKK